MELWNGRKIRGFEEIYYWAISRLLPATVTILRRLCALPVPGVQGCRAACSIYTLVRVLSCTAENVFFNRSQLLSIAGSGACSHSLANRKQAANA